MAKLSATNRIIKKTQRIAPAVRPLAPKSNWWALRGASDNILGQTKFFKAKNIETQGITAISTEFEKNYFQDQVDAAGTVNAVYSAYTEAKHAIAGNRNKLGFSNQG